MGSFKVNVKIDKLATINVNGEELPLMHSAFVVLKDTERNEQLGYSRGVEGTQHIYNETLEIRKISEIDYTNHTDGVVIVYLVLMLPLIVDTDDSENILRVCRPEDSQDWDECAKLDADTDKTNIDTIIGMYDTLRTELQSKGYDTNVNFYDILTLMGEPVDPDNHKLHEINSTYANILLGVKELTSNSISIPDDW